MERTNDATQSSRVRLLTAAKTLFAHNGYEQTSTASIAREAGTSESQLVRYFSSKAGLLEAIFNESWQRMNDEINRVVTAAKSGKDAIGGVLSLLIEVFGNDPELAVLFLLEGRRIRGAAHEVMISKGFQQFSILLQQLIQRAQRDGSFRKNLPDQAIESAVIGAAEGMIRDRLLATRGGKPNPFTDDEIRKVFASILESM
jgi:AcrR family transcriptional regulator